MQDIDHDRQEVKRLANRLLAMIGTAAPPAACALSSIRWELMRRLFTLLMLEQLCGPRRRDMASDLLGRWKAHSLAWTTQRIGHDWDGYVVDAQTMLSEISAFCEPA
ncbi:hypothetical protein [Sphingomonas baiyangensis]|uniref:Uncharacterized protein n=1 Tax=Sphingomonas baiyangensis TaxID=2572576 RepID=A0A4U1L8M3_9SPHN|nr:hypothetical protein [Sphingomonas baiyangensis]TKD53319.1 hypothetical protein FBR43_03080 [Sphingomonas baiyangensis]